MTIRRIVAGSLAALLTVIPTVALAESGPAVSVGAQASCDTADGTDSIEGPTVNLVSEPFPPLLTLEAGSATASFTAQVEGGQPPYSFAWDLNGDGLPEPDDDSGQASFTYTEPGKFLASVTVEDACGLVTMASLPVVVIDPDQEACHPMAQRIADAANTLFADQADQLYTCQDVFDIFMGGLTGSQVGFGRMWHAYRLSQTIDELTWEEIRDWHLDGNGWGLLVQLDRFAEAIGDVGVRELIERVSSGEASVGEVRSAVRAVVRYDADFEDALSRLAGGASPGELNRFYRAAQDLGLDPGALDEALASGATLQELKQAERSEKQAGGNERTAERLAKQFGVTTAQVQSLYDGACAGSWSCVRTTLRQGSDHGRGPKHDK